MKLSYTLGALAMTMSLVPLAAAASSYFDMSEDELTDMRLARSGLSVAYLGLGIMPTDTDEGLVTEEFEQLARQGRGRGRGGDDDRDRDDDDDDDHSGRGGDDRSGSGSGRSKPRIPGGSGCDDPGDIAEHAECRGGGAGGSTGGAGSIDDNSSPSGSGRSRPRVPGGSGCDDPGDILEHPECRV